ncbi:MAG: phospholipid carrier-dependent glycosyltransferase, partial [Treponemataceae bacterium]
SSYGKASVNAYNIWTLFGLNWISQLDTFLNITYENWGYFFILLSIIFSFITYFYNRRNPAKIFLTASQIIICVFLFSVRMHERYLFPAIVLLLIAFIYYPKRELFFSYLLFSTALFYNSAHVLFFYDPGSFDWNDMTSRIFSLFTVCVFIFYAIILFNLAPKKKKQDKIKRENKNKEKNVLHSDVQNISSVKNTFLIRQGIQKKIYMHRDLVIVSVLTLFNAFLIFHDLGYRFAPQTTYTIKQTEELIFDFENPVNLRDIGFFLGNRENRKLFISYKIKGDDNWFNIGEDNQSFVLVSVFKWAHLSVNKTVSAIKLYAQSDSIQLGELVFVDDRGMFLNPSNRQDYKALFDEQFFYDQKETFRSGTYFDEIYYVRTAYEYDQGLPAYENTHPPLGKILIMMGIKLFGFNPFGWRFMSAFFGVLIIPIFFFFAKKIFNSTFFASFAAILLSADFMHFVQSRIATIDIFAFFFIVCTYYAMFCYTKSNFFDINQKKSFLLLAISGITFALATAVKFIGLYAGLGLAVLFFIHLTQCYNVYRHAVSLKPSKQNAEQQIIARLFLSHLLKTLFACFVFFIIIPTIIYTLCYIPVQGIEGSNVFEKMIANQRSMLSYHTSITAKHPFASRWFEWPLMIKPIWYYTSKLSATHSEGISSFGNPFIWWLGIPAFFYMIFLVFKKKDSLALFFLIAFICQYIPWIFIKRITFIYHFFPTVPFLIFMIVYSVYTFRFKKVSFAIIVSYLALTLLLFGIFYPVLAGKPVESSYVKKYLRWMPSWYLVS